MNNQTKNKRLLQERTLRQINNVLQSIQSFSISIKNMKQKQSIKNKTVGLIEKMNRRKLQYAKHLKK